MKRKLTACIVNKAHDRKLYGTVLVIISGVLYGMIGYFGMQLFYQGLSVPNMLFWRFFTAGCWMLLVGMLTRHSYYHLRNNMRLMLKLAAVGSVSYVGGSAFFYLASLSIGTGPAMVIFFSFPIFVTLFSLIFKQSRLNRYVLMALIMVVAGLILLNGSGEHNLNNKGILLAMIASFSYAVYVFYSKRSATAVDSHWLTLLICFGCAMVALCFALIDHSFAIPTTLQATKDILILGILATAIPIQLLLNGLKYISSVKASILSILEPVTTVIVGILFLNESLSTMQVIGVLVMLAGAIIIQFEKPAVFKPKESPFK